MRSINEKLINVERLCSIAEGLRAKGKRLVQCDGVYDFVHPGHIDSFVRARAHGDVLVVVVVADAFVEKGPGRPLFDQQMRGEWIAALECVDYVVINEAQGPLNVIQAAKPDVFVKGRDYESEPTQGFLRDLAAAESYGGRVVFVDELMHATDILERIRASNAERER